jgi:hypothetical protein
MKNLHLKNLNNTDIIDIYLNKIEKIYNNNYDFEKLITLLKKLYTYIEKELETINIINPDIQKYKEYLIDYIKDIKEKELRYPAKKNTYSITNHKILTEYFKNNIEKLKLLNNLDINSEWIKIEHIYSSKIPYYHYRIITVIYINHHFTKTNRSLQFYVNENNIIVKITQFEF